MDARKGARRKYAEEEYDEERKSWRNLVQDENHRGRGSEPFDGELLQNPNNINARRNFDQGRTA